MKQLLVFVVFLGYCYAGLSTNYYRFAVNKNPNHLLGYSIHGLWPNYSNGSWPQYCKNPEKFSENLIEDLMTAMLEDWPSLIQVYRASNKFVSNNHDFWTHEWDRHGTCNWHNLNVHDFFQKTLELFHQAEDKGLISKCSSHECYYDIDLDWIFQ